MSSTPSLLIARYVAVLLMPAHVLPAPRAMLMFGRSVVCAQAPKACSIIVRGASKDVLNEVERNLHDAMGVARNVVRDPRLVPGGGACEMAVSRALRDRSAAIQGEEIPLPPIRAAASWGKPAAREA